jgi:myo-inositol 2-dehydrogenase/D-chiro-inositol 1-dehydrogenase
VSRDPAPPPLAYLKVSGGIWLDQAIHDFDMARFLLKSEPVEVFAMGLCCEPSIAEIGDCDHVMTQVRFANDAICVIDNSRSTPHQAYDQRAELFGTEGCITVGNEYPNTAEYMDVIGQHRDKPLNFFMERYAEAYLQERDSGRWRPHSRCGNGCRYACFAVAVGLRRPHRRGYGHGR